MVAGRQAVPAAMPAAATPSQSPRCKGKASDEPLPPPKCLFHSARSILSQGWRREEGMAPGPERVEEREGGGKAKVGRDEAAWRVAGRKTGRQKEAAKRHEGRAWEPRRGE